ncbi:transposase [Lactococcus cremoris]|uniref:hypothetical protein n=1 Tax=Lactococcus lactis subsp. cremoris TaxID=1359 RepID=UPI003A7F93A6
MARRKFDKQFKNSAVKLILEEGYTFSFRTKTISSCFKINSNFSPFIINFHKHFKNVDDPREFVLV